MKLKRVLAVLLSVVILLACFTGISVVSADADDHGSLNVVGASIRISGVQGLRFVGKYRKIMH